MWLIGGHIMHFKYLVVDLDNDNVKENFKLFARLVYKLGRPDPDPEDVTTHWWSTFKHPTLRLGAMQYDPDFIVPFRVKKNGTFTPKAIAAIEELVTLLYPNATATKKDQIRNFVKNNTGATVEQMLPNTLPTGAELKTHAEMITDGWF